MKQKIYSAEFKIFVIIDMREYHMVYRETIRKYWNTENRGQEGLCLKTIKRWERIFLEEVAEGLMKERRGKACKESGTKKVAHLNLIKRLKKI